MAHCLVVSTGNERVDLSAALMALMKVDLLDALRTCMWVAL